MRGWALRSRAGKPAEDVASYSKDDAFLGSPEGLKKASDFFFLQVIGKKTSRKG